MHGENLMAIKCMSMFRFILGLKMNTRFLFYHFYNLTDTLSLDHAWQVIGICICLDLMKSIAKSTLARLIFNSNIESIN